MPEAEILRVVPKTVIYGKANCKFCDEAKKAFASVELPVEYKDLAETLGFPDAMGEPRPVPKNWRTDGTVDIMASWAMANCPTPLIIVNGGGHRNLSEALTAVNYRDRKRLILKRDRDRGKTDSRPDA